MLLEGIIPPRPTQASVTNPVEGQIIMIPINVPICFESDQINLTLCHLVVSN